MPAVGLAVGLGAFLAWTRRGRPARTRHSALGAALAGAFLGAALGLGALDGLTGLLTAIAGAAAGANLALLAVGAVTDRARPVAPAPSPVAASR